MVKGECFLTGAHRLGLSLLWQNLYARVGWNAGEGLFTWNPKSTEAEDSREESSWGDRWSLMKLWDLSGRDPQPLLSVLSAWSQGSVICHLSSARSKGCSMEAAMNTNDPFLMLYLPQKSRSLLKHRQATAAQCRKTLSGLQQEQEPAWNLPF